MSRPPYVEELCNHTCYPVDDGCVLWERPTKITGPFVVEVAGPDGYEGYPANGAEVFFVPNGTGDLRA